VSVVTVHQRTPEWLALRKDSITATDAAIIAGETGSALELWAQKRGLVDPPEFDDATLELMAEGTAIQPYLLDFASRKLGVRVRNINTVRRSREWPVAICSPDGEVIGQRVGIEAKMTTAAKWPAAFRAGDPVPGDVLAQVQWQMFCTGWDAVQVVVLLFGRPKVIEVPRDPEYLDNLVWSARQFHGWVLSGERPPLDGTENARRVLSALHPRGNGEGLIPAPPEALDMIRAIAEAKAAAKTAADRCGTYENALRALIGDADGFEGEWGKATWKRNADSTRTNWPAVAKEYRALLHDRPAEELDAVESIHTETAEGPRVLRLTLKEAS
jgi:putative phage-type endonuclease